MPQQPARVNSELEDNNMENGVNRLSDDELFGALSQGYADNLARSKRFKRRPSIGGKGGTQEA